MKEGFHKVLTAASAMRELEGIAISAVKGIDWEAKKELREEMMAMWGKQRLLTEKAADFLRMNVGRIFEREYRANRLGREHWGRQGE